MLGLLLLGVLGFFSTNVEAIPMTIKLAANERRCYFTEVIDVPSQIGFYFAVQSGGAFDVDVSITGPDGVLKYDEAKEKQGEFSFSVTSRGEYEFCFSNDMSTFAIKEVEFEIVVDSKDENFNGIRAELPVQDNNDADQAEQTIVSIESRASNLLKTLKYYKTRNNRNQSTVKSTENRIFWFSCFELILMVGMACFHVAVVQFFFAGSRKNLV